MAEAGWFKDRQDPRLARWFDGERWTEHTIVIADQPRGVRPPPPRGAPVAPPPPVRHRPAWGGEPADPPTVPAPFAERTVPMWVAVTLGVLVVALLVALLTTGGDDAEPAAATTSVPAGTVRTPELRAQVPTVEDVDLRTCAASTQDDLPEGLTVVRAGAALSATHVLLAAELDGPPPVDDDEEASARRLHLSFELWEPVGAGGYEVLYAFSVDGSGVATGGLVDSERHEGAVIDPSAISSFTRGDVVGVAVERSALPLVDEAGPTTFAVDAEPQVLRSGWVPSGDPQVCPSPEDTGRITRLELRRG